MNENLYLAHEDVHTKPCMFTEPDAHSAWNSAHSAHSTP